MASSSSAVVVGFVGLDDLSLEMASSLVSSGFRVQGYEEVESPLINRFMELGGSMCSSAMDAAKDAMFIIITTSGDEEHDIFHGAEGILEGLLKDTVVIVRSTMLLSYIQKLETKLADDGREDGFIDMHVFRGASEDLNGKIIVIASGRKSTLQKTQPVLSAICEKIYLFEGEVGSGSKIQMVNNLLEGIHFIASVEAMYLGVRAGVHPLIIYDIISNAAGSSRVFVDVVPKMMSGESTFINTLNSLVKDVGSVINMAKSVRFPLPLLVAAYQQLIQVVGASPKHEDDYSAASLKIWEQIYGVNIMDAANQKSYSPEQLTDQLSRSSKTVKKIGFIGLGAMGFGMASYLLGSGFHVIAYDVYEPTLARFANLGGMIGNSPEEISKDIEVLIIMVANENQADSVLYGLGGSVTALPAGTTIVLSSTVSPGFITQLQHRLEDENKGLKLVDAPVSGGVKRAAEGTLTIMTSGTIEALSSAGSVLSVLSEKLYVIKGGCGAASSVKMVNQLLAGVHIASAAEAMAFAARLGLNTRMLFEVIKHMRGYSWMFGNRVPHMLDSDYKPYSAIDIFVKDLGIVSNESSKMRIPLNISSAALQLFLSGSASGWGRYDDAAVVKVYETLTGVKVEGKIPFANKEDVLKSLPSQWPEDPIEKLAMEPGNGSKVVIVLDDDPTGTQTVHDIEVLTEWSITTLVEQFSKRPTCFFILTNSRSLTTDKAISLTKEICENVAAAAKAVKDIDFTIVLRGDSTLRGHFPEEADAAVSVLGEMDAWIICPFFLQGGRYTINDVHYVVESDRLVPAGETEFSKDAAFGYKSSNLQEWVVEKSKGRFLLSKISSVSIKLLRKGGPSAVCDHLCRLEKGSICIVNAASDRDVAVFAAGMIQAELKGKRYLCRTAASFVSARIGIKPKPPVCPSDLGITRSTTGGLIVVGSYVPKTTKQVEELKSRFGKDLKCIEVSVGKISTKLTAEREKEIDRVAEIANASLKLCKDTLIVTSRQLITGKTPEESLQINYEVSSALVEIVKRISTRPNYILAKGGITSSDIATKALAARRAMVTGQALPGVPLWQLGPESRHPGVPYVVFPGNVGDSYALAEVVRIWSHQFRSSTKDILLNAGKDGYAVGAFNIYNLEGVKAVISAAEAEKSPAILQVHPGALKEGGVALIDCCISAATRASVPITVHFDHGISKTQMLEALELGFDSVMVDGSHLQLEENISYTSYIADLAHEKGIMVEAELGRLSGIEDDLTVEEYEAKLTDLKQAEEFIDKTGIDALAVCIGNVHGKYPSTGPNLRLDLLKDLQLLTEKRGVSLVLHGASGLPLNLVKECIALGVRKFNVNTEVRNAYMDALNKPHKDLVHVMASAKEEMKTVIAKKMRLFGSAGKA